MKTEFSLIGLSKPQSITCEPIGGGALFWPKVNLTKDRFNALFDYCKNHWSDKKIAIIEHNDFASDGTPINPVFIEMKETN